MPKERRMLRVIECDTAEEYAYMLVVFDSLETLERSFRKAIDGATSVSGFGFGVVGFIGNSCRSLVAVALDR